MDVLVALGTTRGLGVQRGRHGRSSSTEHVYFEASAAVITLVLLGKCLEARAKAGTSAALEGLLAAAAADRACRARRRAGRSAAGERSRRRRFVVRAGDAVPVDGLVRDGHLERRREHADRRKSCRSRKQPGDKVFAGTVNQRRHADGGGDRRRQRRRCSPASFAWSPRRRARRRRCSGWSTACRRSSCPSCIVIAALTFVADVARGRRHDARAGSRGRGAGHRVSRARSALRRPPRSWSAPAAARSSAS